MNHDSLSALGMSIFDSLPLRTISNFVENLERVERLVLPTPFLEGNRRQLTSGAFFFLKKQSLKLA
jgi:hypothetical protein